MLGVVDLQWLPWIWEAIVPKTGGWTLWVFHLTPATVFVLTIIAAGWRFKIFRMGEPAIELEVDITSRQCSPSYNAITAVGVMTNTSRVVAKCTTLIWQVRVLAPYSDVDVERKIEEYWEYREQETKPVEFPWNLNYTIPSTDPQISLEPGEINTVSMNLAIPDWIKAIDVQLFLETPGNAKGSQLGWIARCTHDIKEVSNGDQDR